MLQFMTMGLFRKTEAVNNDQRSSLLAQYAPSIMGENLNSLYNYILPRVSRNEAMSVPAVARCRNLLSGVIGGLPLNLYRKSTGEELGNPIWVDQPALNQPRSVTMAWTVDSLMMYGVAYWQVTEVYAEDGRPSRFQWIPNVKVTFSTDLEGMTVTQYYVDAVAVPMQGLGSLVTFQSFDEGILERGSETIRAAIDLRKAAVVAASTPMPSGVLRNNGADLDPKEIAGLLAAWKNARNNRSTAYLTSTLEYQPTSFSPKDMMYDEAQQFLATEISRLCGIPAYLLSAEANTSMTYANVLDERKQFFSMSLEPYVNAIQDRLSMDDITARGNAVRFDVDSSFLKTEPMERLLVIEKMLSLGLITVEQAMEMENLTPNGSEGIA
jgi:HK97 family phage portal protein